LAITIDETLVSRLISEQFPALGDLPIRPVAKQGWDNRTFRLGEKLSIRLPSEEGYAAAVEKEAIALTALAPYISVPLPQIYAMGEPTEFYPLPWSIRYWQSGETLEVAPPRDRSAFAVQLAKLLIELRNAPATKTLEAGVHSFYRGCHPTIYENEVHHCLDLLKLQIDAEKCLAIWQSSIQSTWSHPPVWFHGDIAVGNILMHDGKISALIDFGTCGVGDPACDYAIAWTYFTEPERAQFQSTLQIDQGTWQRAKAWALWKSLVTLSGRSSPDQNGIHARTLKEILNEPVV
jgi:aminoglycoside phosphotransferase (APT) family kinase protein